MKRIKLLFHERERRLKYNSLIMLLCQFLTMAVSFLLIPIIMGYIGVADYGIWITLIGIIEWFNLFDIGLGHGLRNRYVEAKASGNIEAINKYVSTAFFMLLFISCGIFFVFSLLSLFLNWSSILNAPQEMAEDLNILVLFIGAFFCIRFVVNIVNILLTADHYPAIPAIILLISNVFSLCTVYFLTKTTESSILKLGIYYSISQLLPLLVAFVYFFATKYHPIIPHFSQFSEKYIRMIFSLGGQFFLIQITAMLLFTTNNLIIAHTCEMTDVAEFNVAFKYMNIVFMIFMTMLTPLWSACTEAYTRGDIVWIKNIFKRMNKIWLLLFAFGLILVVTSPFVYKIWLKDEVKPNFLLLGMMLVYVVLLMRYTLYRTFMNGTGKIRLQFYITSIESLLHIPLAVLMGQWIGIYGVLLVMIIWAVVNSVWEPIQYKRILNKSAQGIWLK